MADEAHCFLSLSTLRFLLFLLTQQQQRLAHPARFSLSVLTVDSFVVVRQRRTENRAPWLTLFAFHTVVSLSTIQRLGAGRRGGHPLPLSIIL